MTPVEARLRSELEGRRERLAQVAAGLPEERLVELLHRVDTALARLETPDWGLCEALSIVWR